MSAKPSSKTTTNASVIKVEDFRVEDLTPKIDDPSLVELIPKVLLQERVSFTISGVSNAVSNGLRRTLLNELLIKALFYEYDSFSTNDPFINGSMLINRIRLLPIHQDIPDGTVFEIDTQNSTDSTRYVYSSDIKIIQGSKKESYFNGNIPLCTLYAGNWLRIKRITVRKDYGYNFAGHCITSNAASIALDQIPLNMYLPEDDPNRGIPSRVSNPQKWKLSFISEGAMDARALVRYACDNIIERLNNIEKILYSIEQNGNDYILTVNMETDTIGNLFMKTISEMYPAMDVRYTVGSVTRTVHIHIRCNEDVESVIKSVIERITGQYESIKHFFK